MSRVNCLSAESHVSPESIHLGPPAAWIITALPDQEAQILGGVRRDPAPRTPSNLDRPVTYWWIVAPFSLTASLGTSRLASRLALALLQESSPRRASPHRAFHPTRSQRSRSQLLEPRLCQGDGIGQSPISSVPGAPSGRESPAPSVARLCWQVPLKPF